MRCNNCDINIDSKFYFAIKNNNCPACGKYIMPPEKLASYINLQQLIKDNFSDVNSEKVATLIVANFELKQLFKESSGNKPIASRSLEDDEDVEVTEDELTDKESDELHKANQMATAKAKLKSLREQAYKGALQKQYGMEKDSDESFFDGDLDTNPIEFANRLESEQKLTTSQGEMFSGTGGFSRSDA